MRKEKKVIYTVNVDGYAPEITAITYPLIERYAKKIGAEFHIIKDRKFPDFPPMYEKFQIRELAKQNGADWNIYIDSDALVHPDLFDITNHLTKDTVFAIGKDMAGNRWKYDEYFKRDGRHIGIGNWILIASDWCLDVWQPLDISKEEALEHINPVVVERNLGITPEHVLDDYTVSRNIARYGLKFKDFDAILNEANQQFMEYFWHKHLHTREEKVQQLTAHRDKWLAETNKVSMFIKDNL